MTNQKAKHDRRAKSRDESRSEITELADFDRRDVLKSVAGATVLGGVSVGGAAAKDGDGSEDECEEECYPSEGEDGDPTATWTIEQASEIERTDATTAPVIESLDRMAPNLWVWDSWPLRNMDGSVACVDGWMVMFSLTSPDALLPGKRHDVAEIRYFYSRDGVDWQLGGRVFEPNRPLGNRQWASSAILDRETDEVYFFYTAVGDEDNVEDTYPPVEGGLTYEQRLALAHDMTIETTDEGVGFDRRWEHEIILTADGEWYQTQEQAGDGIVYAFRDPWFFEDPDNGCKYLIFEGNTPVDPSETSCEAQDLDEGDYLSGVAAEGAQFNGNIGFAASPSGDMTEWELRPPLLDAVCVNQQLERGNIVVQNDRYYLFADSHKFTFPPDLDGPDGLYGWVADSVHGDYTPLNESGLVIANPEEQPFQAYSWMPVPYPEEDDRVAVLSYYNYHDLDGRTLKEVGDFSEERQREVFGGTLAPTLVLEIDDAQTEIVETLPPGYLPSKCSDLASDTNEYIERG